MNDLVILGILGFSLFIAQEFLDSVRLFFRPLRRNLMTKAVPEKNFFLLLISRVLLAASLPLPRIYLHKVLQEAEAQPQKMRTSLLSFALTVVTLWPVFLFTLTFFSLNSILILGLGFLLVIAAQISFLIPSARLRFSEPLHLLAKIIIYFALLGLSFEFTLRWTSLIQTWGTQNGISYFLADGRLENLVQIILLGLVCSVVIPYESWYWLWSLTLYVNGQLSLNGAVAFFLSGVIGSFVVQLFQKNAVSKDIRKIKREGIILAVFLLVLGFIVFGFIKPGLSAVNIEDSQEQKIMTLIVSWLVILVPLFIGSMVWGHFKALQKSRS